LNTGPLGYYEKLGTANEWATKLAGIMGAEETKETLEKFGDFFTLANAVNHFVNRQYFDLFLDGLGAVKQASPYVFVYENLSSMFTGEFTTNQAAVD
jgi:hypothetical protein